MAEDKEKPADASAPKRTIRLKPVQANKSTTIAGLPPGVPSATQAIGATPVIPGVTSKQTIRLRSSSSTSIPANPATVPTDTSRLSRRTIKLTPQSPVPTDTSRLSRRTIKLIHPSSSNVHTPAPSAPTIHLGGTTPAPSAPTIHLGGTTPAPSASTIRLGENTSSSQTIRLGENAPSSQTPTVNLAKTGSTPLRLKKMATQTALPENLQHPPELPGKESTGKQDEPGVIFLISSIVALLVLAFLAFAMFAQYSNFYSGSDINVPALQRLSSSRK